ncbi:MAG: hypothetical protein RLZZ500_1777 [Bacteroidota bacterium]|jgi:O-antigen/teichoic acid export membrane protein
MGIVQTQSIRNTIITFFGFGIGAINALFFYTSFLQKEYYGIVSTVLSGANILMPILAFGVQNTIIRFFSQYETEEKREQFLSFIVLMPLALILPLGFGFYYFYDEIAGVWLRENPSLKPFFWLIPVVGLFMAYFEVFYAWVKVHMQSVFGNFISEVLVRSLVMVMLLMVHFNVLSKPEFVYGVAIAYFGQTLGMFLYAMKVRRPSFRIVIPENIREVVYYSSFIIVSGGVAVMLVDFDKVLIPKYKAIEENAVYSVAIFFATVIAVPFRAMTQIVAPITAKLMVEKKWEELNDLYQKTSINLQIAGGFIMLIIFVNVNEMYRIVPDDYSAGLWVVFMIGLSKYYDVLLGNNNSIIVNTHYYRTVLLFGVVTVVLMIVLNALFIPPYGINGSAFATLLTIMIYNTIKFFFVVKKMKLFPFTPKTLVSLAIVSVGFVLFYFWDFPFHPVLNIALKSILVTFYFVVLHFKMNVSTEVNQVIQKVAARFAIRL